MKTAALIVYVDYDETRTDAESVATALDRLMETGLSTRGILDDYGQVDVSEFLLFDADCVTQLI